MTIKKQNKTKTAGLALEIATAAAPPSAFVPLAGAGTLCRAVGKGIARPAFRVVQTHFATPAVGAAAVAAGAADDAPPGADRPAARWRQDQLREQIGAG
jgi:hypothetical protein